MLEKLGVLVIGLVIGAASLFFLKPDPAPPPPTVWQGEVKPVQKQISVEIPVSYSELVVEHEGPGVGKAMMTTNHILLIGVNFPSDWKYNSKKDADGVVTIELPELELLNEISIEIEDYEETVCNLPTGTQTRQMERDFKRRARDQFSDKASELVSNSKNVYDLSRSSFEKYYLRLLNDINKDNPARLVNVKFENEPVFK